MDRNRAKQLLPIIQAYAEGKTIQSRLLTSPWYDEEDPYFDDNIEYRIKPEKKYRPFNDAEECWAEMQKHQPLGWVKSTLFKDLALFQKVTTLYVKIDRDIIDYKDALEKFTFADGAPFGVKMEK